jgi:hypothetical protein
VSLVGATTPLVQGRGGGSRYWRALLAHTAGSIAAGAAAGALLGALGHAVNGTRGLTVRTGVVAVIGIGLGLQEVGVLRLPTMQISRQTSKQWREVLGAVGAPLAWGLDLGSGLTTYVIYEAYWVFPVAAVARGDVAYGVLLLGAFGFARAVSVVVASLAARDAAKIPIIGDGTPFHAVLLHLTDHAPVSRHEHGWGVIGACVAVLVNLAL